MSRIMGYNVLMNEGTIWLQRPRTLFVDRKDAGEKLAPRLENYRDKQAIILAIPRGGVEVAAPLSQALSIPLDVIVVRKLPIPWNPEMGMGAITADGYMILDEPLFLQLGITPTQLEKIAERVRHEIERRRRIYRADKPVPQLGGKTIIIVDDGLATGYTMLAAIKSVKSQNAAKIVAAVPVASVNSAYKVESEVDEFITLAIADMPSFAVADYYQNWTDLSDTEVLALFHPQTPLKEKPRLQNPRCP